MRRLVLLATAVSLAAGATAATSESAAAGRKPSAPTVYVTFWFDTEDYLLPAADDAAKRLAGIFDSQGVRATFKVVGEKARVLRRRGRTDVIEALRRHDIGYHTNFHSVHPTPAEYERDLDWDEGVEEFLRREGEGFRDVERIFGKHPSCYGQPGSSWTPESYGALRKWGIPVYLDDATHVRLDGRPFWYCGILNVLNLRGCTTRAGLGDEASVREGCEAFERIRKRVVAEGGGLVSIYYHPCEWVHEKFWDGVNFAKGANPPRSLWRRPPQKPSEVTERWFRNFSHYLEYVRTRPNVRLVTASEIALLYRDRAYSRPFDRREIEAMARSVEREVTFVRLGDRTLSAAEALSILAQAVVEFDTMGRLPRSLWPRFFFGPSDRPTSPVGSGEFAWERWVEGCRDFLDATSKLGRMPAVVWVAGKSLDPVDFAATLGSVVGRICRSGKAPERVALRRGEFSAAKYVADDSPRLWGWVIFPPNFRAPKMMALARLQAWTIKPAVLHPENLK